MERIKQWYTNIKNPTQRVELILGYVDTIDYTNQLQIKMLQTCIKTIQKHNLWGNTFIINDAPVKIIMDNTTLPLQKQKYQSLKTPNSLLEVGLKKVHKQEGIGIPLLASSNSIDKYVPPSGHHFPVTATLIKKEEIWCIKIQDPYTNSNLSANFSSPLTELIPNAIGTSVSGLINCYYPIKGMEHIGLYTNEPIDPTKTPLILSHGLISNPYFWVHTTNALLGNKNIRDKYQLYYYFYPTSLPLIHSAAKLKLEIRTLHKKLCSMNKNKFFDDIALIGHSMGGLISSVITKNFTNKETDTIKNNDIKCPIIKLIIKDKPLSCIKKVIFIATPHNGSKHADSKIVDNIIDNIKIPIQKIYKPTELTEIGHHLFNPDYNQNGIQHLKLGNKMLTYIKTLPVVENTHYYSIIGNKKNNNQLIDSCDGVVTYQSASIPNVESECIVPTWHNAQHHPDTCNEIIKILT